MYSALEIPPGTPDLVAAVVRDTVDPRLSDVHAMLRLPLDDDGLKAGCNFAIADTLFGVLEGISAVLFPRYGDPGPCFKECVSLCYHPERERSRQPAVASGQVADLLSSRYRNSMQHALGLALRHPDKQGIRFPDRHGDTLFVFRDKPQLSEDQIVAMENEEWPAFLDRPTLGWSNGQLILSVEAFYVGTRRLIHSVLAKMTEMKLAATELANLFQDASEAPSQLGSGLQIPQTTMVNSGVTASAMTTISPLYKPDSSG